MLKNKHKSMILNSKSTLYLTEKSIKEMNMANLSARSNLIVELRKTPIPITVDSRQSLMVGLGSCA